jgi:hypothetical protein
MQALYNKTKLVSSNNVFVSFLLFFFPQEIGSISGIHDAIYKVLSTQALYNGTELVTSRRLVREVIQEVATSNGFMTANANSSSSTLGALNETDVKILLDIVATVSPKFRTCDFERYFLWLCNVHSVHAFLSKSDQPAAGAGSHPRSRNQQRLHEYQLKKQQQQQQVGGVE